MTRGNLAFLVVIALALAGLLLLSPGSSKAAIPACFSPGVTLDEARAKAASSGKPVLAFFTADWCGPCQALKRGALADAAVSAAISARTVPVYVDMTDVRADSSLQALARAHGINAFPTLVLISGDQQISRIVGGASPSELTAWVEANTGLPAR